MKKNIVRTLIAMLILTMAMTLSTYAAAAIKRTQYESNGKVEVEFKTRVQYKKVKVTVTDPAGKQFTAPVVDKDRNELEFKIKGAQQGKTYSFKISGIRKVGEKKYRCVKGIIRIPTSKGNVPVKEIEYFKSNKNVEFDFTVPVQWKKAKVTITDGKNQYVVKITKRNKKEIKVRVKGLKAGAVYSYTISGIRRYGKGKYGTISGTFTA